MNAPGQKSSVNAKSNEQITFELMNKLGRWITSAELKKEFEQRGSATKNVAASLSSLATKGRIQKLKPAEGQVLTLYGPLGLPTPEPVNAVNLVKSPESNGTAVSSESHHMVETGVAQDTIKNGYAEILNSGTSNIADDQAPTPQDEGTSQQTSAALDSAVQDSTPQKADEPGATEGSSHGAPQKPATTKPVIIRHRLLDSAGVPDAVITKRGYRYVTSKADLRALGFSEKQAAHVPALVVPVHGPDGSLITYLLYPDQPAMVSGRVQRYLLPNDAQPCLDVPPESRSRLQDSSPIMVVDDVLEADAAPSQCLGLVCYVALIGFGAQPSHPDQLPEWTALSLSGRKVLLVFPSVVEPALHKAYTALKQFLTGKGASVGIVCLPSTDHTRVTLSSFLSQGKAYADILQLATDSLPPPPVQERPLYERTSTGLVWNDPDGERVPIANFNAIITHENVRDDDISTTTNFDIEIEHEGETLLVTVPAHQFRSLRWAETKAWARVYTRQRDKVPDAVRYLSGRPQEVVTYTHTGWRKLDEGRWGYLHGDGAITADGLRKDVRVDLPRELLGLRLPPPPEGEALRDAVLTTLGLLDLSTKDRISAPLFALIGRAPLGSMDSTPHLVGQTGAFKSSTAQLIQRAFGAGFHRDKPPLSWISTGNANELVMFAAKDALVVVDDFRRSLPSGQREAERLVFAQGNEHGRSRAVGGKAVGHSPRGVTLSTGEETPVRDSLRARMLIIDLERGDIPQDRLTKCQAHAAAGSYAKALSAYLRWLAPRIEGLRANLQQEKAALSIALDKVHRRTDGAIADLLLGVKVFLDFATDSGALSASERAATLERCSRGIVEAGCRQAAHQAEADPIDCYFSALRSALAQGDAHLTPLGQSADPNDDVRREQWGWRPNEGATWEWTPCGKRIGWLSADRSEVYLLPRDTYSVVIDNLKRSGVTSTLGERGLSKLIFGRGLLVDSDIKKARGVYTVRPSAIPGRPDVLHVRAEAIWPSTEPDPPDQAPTTPTLPAPSAGQMANSPGST